MTSLVVASFEGEGRSPRDKTVALHSVGSEAEYWAAAGDVVLFRTDGESLELVSKAKSSTFCYVSFGKYGHSDTETVCAYLPVGTVENILRMSLHRPSTPPAVAPRPRYSIIG